MTARSFNARNGLSVGTALGVIDRLGNFTGNGANITNLDMGNVSAGILPGTYGGTGVNNSTRTITVAGNFATAGAFATTLTSTAATSVTLPTTGTLATRDGAETFTNKTLTSPIVTTGLTTGSTTFALLNTTATTVNFAGAASTLAIGASLGTTTLGGVLRLPQGSDVTPTSTAHAFQIGSTASTNLIIDDNEIMARNNGVVSTLLINDGGNITLGTGLSTVTVSGTLNITGTATVPTPTVGSDAATKAYVDAVATGTVYAGSCRVATTANITLSAPQTIDGVSAVAGNRVLVKNQSTTSQNGIYVVAAGAWTRATDYDSSAEIVNSAVLVLEGSTLAGSTWAQTTAGTITVGTTAIVFVQIGAATTLTFGTGLLQTGNTVNVVTASSTRIVTNTDNIDLGQPGDTNTGTFQKVTVDVYGRVTGTTAVVASDINTLIGTTYVAVAGDTMTGALSITAATASTSKATGALIVTGGAGIGGTLNAEDIRASAGAFASPSISFTGDTTTGLFNVAGTTLGFSVAGAQELAITAGLSTFGGAVRLSTTGLTVALSSSTGSTFQNLPGTINLSNAASSTVSNATSASFAVPVFTATNTGIIFTNASTVLIAGAPSGTTAGNITRTNVHALQVTSGRIFSNSRGSLAIPAYAIGDVDTGIFSSAANTLDVVTGGTLAASFSSIGELTTVGDIYAPNGSVGSPAYSFSGNVDTGMYATSTTSLNFSLNGTNELAITSGTSTFGGSIVSNAAITATTKLSRANSAFSTAAWTSSGVFFDMPANTVTDNTSGASTIALRVANSFSGAAFASSAVLGVTIGATLYIAGPPANGANTTIASAYSLYIPTGQTRISGGTLALPSLVLNDTNSGLYSSAAGSISVVINGTDRLNVTSSGVTVTGTVTATSFNATSTNRVKTAIKDLSAKYLEKFADLVPREYDRTDCVAHEFGFVAEEMATVYPEIVGRDTDGNPSGIDYGRLSAILTAKVQSQQSLIEKLQAQMSQVMGMLKGVK